MELILQTLGCPTIALFLQGQDTPFLSHTHHAMRSLSECQLNTFTWYESNGQSSSYAANFSQSVVWLHVKLSMRCLNINMTAEPSKSEARTSWSWMWAKTKSCFHCFWTYSLHLSPVIVVKWISTPQHADKDTFCLWNSNVFHIRCLQSFIQLSVGEM